LRLSPAFRLRLHAKLYAVRLLRRLVICNLASLYIVEHLCLDGIETEHLADGREAAAVYGRCAECAQSTIVCRRGVAFVRGETVAGVVAVEFAHERVARRLGDDGGGGDGGREHVAVNDAALWGGALRNLARVHEHVVGRVP